MKGWLQWFYKILPFKKQFFLLLRILPIPQSIYRHFHFEGIITVKVEDGAFKMIHYGYELENEVFWRGLEGWEKSTFKVWSALSRKADCVIDIGANTGVFALMTKAINRRSRVIAFEPVKRVCEKLNENIKLNQFDITVVEAGVSSLDGTAIIYDLPSEHIYSVTINKNFNDSDQKVIPTVIRITTLSSYARIQKLKKIDLVKIDVETHEPEVLEGMEDILERDMPALIVEILNEDVANKVDEFLKPFGYLYFLMNDEKGPQRTQSIRVNASKNYLVCSSDDAEYLASFSILAL